MFEDDYLLIDFICSMFIYTICICAYLNCANLGDIVPTDMVQHRVPFDVHNETKILFDVDKNVFFFHMFCL